jgi:hypothetical protein
MIPAKARLQSRTEKTQRVCFWRCIADGDALGHGWLDVEVRLDDEVRAA